MAVIQKTMKGFMKNIKQKPRKRNHLPWLNSTIRSLMKQRDYALKIAIKTKTTHERDKITSLRNKVTKEIRTAKTNLFIGLTSNTRGNAKEIWTNIKELTGNNGTNKNIRELELNGNLTHDSNEIATALNIYFIDSVKNLVPNSYSQIQLTEPPNTATPVLNLSEVSQLGVVVCGLNNSKAKDAFDMETMFLKAHKQSLTTPMTSIINKSITVSIIPKLLEICSYYTNLQIRRPYRNKQL